MKSNWRSMMDITGSMISWSVCEVLLLAGCGVTSDISSTGTTSSLQQESPNGEVRSDYEGEELSEDDILVRATSGNCDRG